jgi:hypothetical protein
MNAILTDTALRKALKKVDKIPLRSLWTHVNDIAMHWALIGAVDYAWRVWEFLYSGAVVVPKVDTAFGDCGITALCYYLKKQDLSHGRPTSEYVKPKDGIIERMLGFEDELRPRLTWGMGVRGSSLDDIDFTSQSHSVNGTTPSELEALPRIEAILANEPLAWYTRANGHLLCSDIAYRAGLTEQAAEHLHGWYAQSLGNGNFVEYIMCLRSTSALAFSGALATISNISPDERRQLVDGLLATMKRATDQPYTPPAAPDKIKATIFYSTLLLEPADDDVWETEFEIPENTTGLVESPQAHPRVVAMYFPEETGVCDVIVKTSDTVPSWDSADYVVAFPMRVLANEREHLPAGRVGTVFPNTPTSEKPDIGFAILPGDYDVLACCRRMGEDAIGLCRWRVVLTFLPKGLVVAGILKTS